MTTSFLRRMEGIAQAKKRGVHTGRKKALSQEQVIDIRDRINAGETKPRSLDSTASAGKPCTSTCGPTERD